MISKILSFVKVNKLPILALLFFIIFKFLLIYTLWHNRILPPEPDDSLIYIANIESVRKCPTFLFCPEYGFTLNNDSGFEHLSYRILWGTVAKLFSLSSQEVFLLSFYLGAVILAITIYRLLSQLTKNKTLIAFSIFMLALYNGAGGYHGFFWVVPSFFALLFFLLIFAYIINDNKKINYFYLFILILTYVYLHSISIYLSIVIGLYCLVYCLLIKRVDRLLIKKAVIALLLISISYGASSLYLARLSVQKTYGIGSFSTAFGQSVRQGFENNSGAANEAPKEEDRKFIISISEKIPSINLAHLLPGFSHIYGNYIKLLFSNPLLIALFLLITWSLWVGKQYKTLSFYFASIIMMIMSSINIYGYRSLLLIWPVTYIYYGFGLYYLSTALIQKTTKPLRNIGIVLLISFFSIFVFTNITYAYLVNSDINKKNNYNITRSIYDNMSREITPESKVYIDPKARKILEAFNIIEGRSFNSYIQGQLETAQYYVYLKKDETTSSTNYLLNNLYELIATLLNVERKLPPPSSNQATERNYTEIGTFGDLILYKI